MKNNLTYKNLLFSLVLTLLSIVASNAQYMLEAPSSGDESNYRWYNATEKTVVLSTDSFLEVFQPGVFFAIYDGTLCGKNATGYFIVTNCGSPYNQVSMDISANVPSGSTVSWSPAITGDASNPMVITTTSVAKFTPTVTKAGVSFTLPNFTVVCMATDIDFDKDGILDSYEDLDLDGDNDPETNPTDTDGDGVPDYQDIDADNDGVPDNVEAQTTMDYIAPSGIDDNSNGVDDIYEDGAMFGLSPIDTDGDGIPDYLDYDSDNDSIPDNIEAHDHNHDGIADYIFVGSDKDLDGLDDSYEGQNQIDADVNDEIDDPYNDLPNTDGDEEPDYRDTDDDNDDVLTSDEDLNKDGDYLNDDSNGNGTPEYLDYNPNEDEIQIYNVITPNGDGTNDVLIIEGLEDFPDNSIQIYNRWGVQVYETSAYNTEGNFFDGTSQGRVTLNGEEALPVGTYFYLLEYKDPLGATKTLSGYLYLNK